jgi:hypothetical protein
MSSKHLAALVVSFLILIASGFAQQYDNSATIRNELSATVGRTFISSQHIQGADFFNPNIHFGNGLTVGGNYSRQLKDYGWIGLSAELPVVVDFDTDLNTGQNLIPEGYRSFFATPSLRANFFPSQGLSPWVSGGGGYGLFKKSDQLVFGGPNPGKITTNTGVIQFGAGLDVWPWRKWGVRLEARDFYSGMPDLNVTTVRSRQHNYYVGGGVIYRF